MNWNKPIEIKVDRVAMDSIYFTDWTKPYKIEKHTTTIELIKPDTDEWENETIYTDYQYIVYYISKSGDERFISFKDGSNIAYFDHPKNEKLGEVRNVEVK